MRHPSELSVRHPIGQSRTFLDDPCSRARACSMELVDGEADAMYLAGIGCLHALRVVLDRALPGPHCPVEDRHGIAYLAGEDRRRVGTNEVQRSLPMLALVKRQALALGGDFCPGLVLGRGAPAIARCAGGIHAAQIAGIHGEDRLWRPSKRSHRHMTPSAAGPETDAAPMNERVGFARSAPRAHSPYTCIRTYHDIEAAQRELESPPYMGDRYIVRDRRRNARLEVAGIRLRPERIAPAVDPI